MNKNRLKTLVFAIMAAMTATAQKQFTLEDLNFGGVNAHKFVPANKHYAWWGDELVRLDVEECFKVDKKTGRETCLFTLSDLNGWLGGENKVATLLNAAFPYAGETVVKVRQGADMVLADWKACRVEWRVDVAGLGHADWTPASKATAYVDAGQQLCIRTAGGEDIKITEDGSREIVYGQSVHRDEFGIHKGTFWSPDGTKLAFYRMDQSMVADYPQVDLLANPMALHMPDKYPMAGQTSHKVTVGVYDTKAGKTTYLKAGDPTDRYFTNVQWSPDGKSLYMFELNRGQDTCRLVAYDAATGDRKGVLYEETDDKYVEPQNPIAFLPWDSGKFILQSQKDGYNHLYVYDTAGRFVKQLTKGDWVVTGLLGFNHKARSVVFTSNETHPLQRNVFAVDVKTGKRTALDNGRGVHSPSLSASGTFVLDKYQEPDVPRNIVLSNTKTARRLQLFSAPDPWKGYAVPEYTSGNLTADDGKTQLYYRMVKPVGFDPAKKYPAVVYVYGGPHAHNVEASWHWASRSWETYMAQKGYLLFILDNRGSENRGKDFEQATFRQLGQVEMRDQMTGVSHLMSLPYVDKDRIGVHGWSFGGFMTISLMTNHPEVFKVGVAGGPVIDWKWYEVMYGERYMDTPQENPEGYSKTSLLPKAKDLKGRLQIITGTNDATVVPQHCEAFIHECVKAGTQPDYFVYPGEPHNMRGHQSVHLHERITRYFEDHLK